MLSHSKNIQRIISSGGTTPDPSDPPTNFDVEVLGPPDPPTNFNVEVFGVEPEGDPYAPVHGNEFTWGGFTYKVVVRDYGGGNRLAWLDRNLGASRVATSSTDSNSYGYLYQWGRLTDGHQIRTSGTTETLSTTDEPGHGSHILAPDSPNDWRSPQNDNLWQGVNGTNNPAPPGWRLPTKAEWQDERRSWSTNNDVGAFASPLKLPMTGQRNWVSGSLTFSQQYGYYWSSTVDGTRARFLFFSSGNAFVSDTRRAAAHSVRCVRSI